MGDALDVLRAEKERLELVKANAQLRSEIALYRLPWWRRASIVTALTGIVAGVIPATTAVQGYFQKKRELALQENKQQDDMYVRYLDRLKDPTERERTIRFLVATTSDHRLREWAEGEKRALDAEIAELKRDIDSWKKKYDAATIALSDARNQTEAEIAAHRHDADVAEAAMARLRSQLKSPPQRPTSRADKMAFDSCPAYLACLTQMSCSGGDRACNAACERDTGLTDAGAQACISL